MAASPRLHLGFSPARFSAIRANFSAKLDAREAPHLHLSNGTSGSARIVAITAITAGHRERRNSSPRRSAAAILLCRSVHQARKRGSSPWFQGAAFFIRPKKRDRYRAALARIRGTSVTSARSTVHPSYAGKSPRGSNCKAILFFVAPHGPTMADTEAEHIDAVEEELEAESNYKPPPEKTIEQLLEADKEDESLKKYKETLLGEAKSGGIVVDPEDPRKVIVKKLALCVAGRPDMELDLTGDLSQLKKQTFIIKEGVSYKIRIDFIVQREIVHGLKYVQKTYRLGVLVDKMTHMVGSYPPKKEIQSYTTPSEDAPAGMIARGSYFVSSLFTDDDKHEHLNWEWPFVIKKDWQE